MLALADPEWTGRNGHGRRIARENIHGVSRMDFLVIGPTHTQSGITRICRSRVGRVLIREHVSAVLTQEHNFSACPYTQLPGQLRAASNRVREWPLAFCPRWDVSTPRRQALHGWGRRQKFAACLNCAILHSPKAEFSWLASTPSIVPAEGLTSAGRA